MEYLNTFSSGNDNDEDSNFELEKLLTNFEQVTLPEIAISHVELWQVTQFFHTSINQMAVQCVETFLRLENPYR